jgi:hypothetical protein
MHLLNEVINYVSNLPPSTWTTLVSYLGGSTLVASVLQVLKHKFKFADAEKLIVFALGFFSFIAAFADFLLQSNPTLSALPWLGHATGLLMAGAVVVHRFAVSPAYYSLTARLQGFDKLLKEAEKEDLPAAGAIPAEVVNSVPVSQPAVAVGLPDEANLAQFQV